ncbi:Fe(3+)-hydroxamate ABC transporter permease FhuB [Microvirga sp. CF3016]|uniref:Fe(3+)-hydroxamate ABC transporter permease FhuB n=1 Tax=Microvirga sp. CF3016 TaxID=3110181 RepID=UPI002E7954BB|nr:Fe(3+)-hydroxamate ABC transporter permease FhuB [Microvirga sp. CF3016]MEE1611456.1 Fe(3+)-hydroxamate ABC transporter permease FhuB [Microvirga sp. CF3016]
MARAMIARPFALAWLLAAAVALGLCWYQVLKFLPLAGDHGFDLNRILLLNSVLPRTIVAMLSGAALGLSGALLQQVLRNPIADPSTLGISAGAQFAMTAATLFVPALMDAARESVALFGGLAVVALLLSLSWQRGLEPVTVVLAGMVISLIAMALSATLILANGEYMMSLLIWGSGSLTQQGWDHAQAIALTLVPALVAAFLLIRPLEILGLDDASARSLGVNLLFLRLLALAVAVWLATTVTAEVGVIGFVGLAAPTFARLGGARTQRDIFLAAPLVGATILWLTDGIVQLIAGGSAEMVPTGAATALLGGPLLLYLLPRLQLARHASIQALPSVSRRIAHPALSSLVILILVLSMLVVALLLGRGPNGWSLASGQLLEGLYPFRAPRIVAAAAAGAMLAAAGTILQRMTDNPLASPEVLGISAGAGVGLAAVLFTLSVPTMAARLIGATIGVLVVLVVLLAIARNQEKNSERLLLGGLAAGALCNAIVNAAMITGDARAFQLLAWISGSTTHITWTEASVAVATAFALLGLLPLMTRWLEILPLGSDQAQAVGLPLRTSRMILTIFAAGLTAAASLVVGPLSFVGLVAPHMARLVGFGRAYHQLLAAILIGAGMMTGADWLSRIVSFPYQLPLGLFASLIGGPYLIWLLRRNR